jgi:hypothetical protein
MISWNVMMANQIEIFLSRKIVHLVVTARQRGWNEEEFALLLRNGDHMQSSDCINSENSSLINPILTLDLDLTLGLSPQLIRYSATDSVLELESTSIPGYHVATLFVHLLMLMQSLTSLTITLNLYDMSMRHLSARAFSPILGYTPPDAASATYRET